MTAVAVPVVRARRSHHAVRRAVLLPRNGAIALLVVYRRIVSPLYGDVCRYHPSCSRYALGAVQQSGLLVGAALAAWRVLRCNPWSRGGVDDPPALLAPDLAITPHGFVAPRRPEGS